MSITKPIKDERYVFETEWYDPQADIIRHYRVFYFPQDNTIEMYDKKVQKVFLKRVEVTGLSLADFYIGAKVTVFSRVLYVASYGDIATQVKQNGERESTFAMIKPAAVQHAGKIIAQIQRAGFQINRLKMSRFTRETSEVFYGEHVGKQFFPNLQNFITSGNVIGLELVADGAIQRWRNFIGPTDTAKAKREAPQSIRAQFGVDGTSNACHGSDSTASAQRELDFFFGGFGKNKAMAASASLNSCSLCILKPHLIRSGEVGNAIDCILQGGFDITGAQLFNLSRPQIEEFYDVYKGVLPEYVPLIEHMSNGPTLILEVCSSGDAVNNFRDFVGPYDPEVAVHLKPNTLRAKFGQDRVKNACHCTDLAEDGILECQYFFDILQA